MGCIGNEIREKIINFLILNQYKFLKKADFGMMEFNLFYYFLH